MAYGNGPDSKDGVSAEIKKQEGAALHRVWRRYKKRTQAEFMDSLGLSPNYLPQFFLGKRPITMQLAVALMEELDVDIIEFSPRLAREREKAVEASDWPFRRISRHDYQALTKAQKDAIEAFAATFLPEAKAAASTKFPRGV
jgi:transcriptional regulator with XRE-family HTH domain